MEGYCQIFRFSPGDEEALTHFISYDLREICLEEQAKSLESEEPV